MSNSHHIRHHAVHTLTLFAAIGIGIAIGSFFPKHHELYHTVCQLYLALLEMSVLPVMSMAVITSLGNLFHQGSTWFYLKRMLVVFTVGMLLASAVALIFDRVIAPGARLPGSSIETISQALLAAEAEPAEAVPLHGPWGLLQYTIPHNIVDAMAKGQMLPVLFISILLGIGLGIQSDRASRRTIEMLRTVYTAFIKIIGWVMVGLPIGICALFAEYSATIGAKVFEALLWSTVTVMCGYFLMLVVHALAISISTRQTFGRSFYQLREPLFLGFFTASSLLTMPTMLETLKREFVLDRNVTDITIPLGLSLNRQSAMVRFISIAVFLAQLYGKPMGLADIPMLVVTAFVSSLAGAGLPAITSISMSGIMFSAMGLPAAVGITIMHATEPLLDPFATVVNVMAGCSSCILIAKKKPGEEDVVPASGE